MQGLLVSSASCTSRATLLICTWGYNAAEMVRLSIGCVCAMSMQENKECRFILNERGEQMLFVA